MPQKTDGDQTSGRAQPLRIDLNRTGGYGGIPFRGSIDLAAISPAQAAELTELIERVDLVALEHEPAEAARPDEFRYNLTVRYPDRSYSLVAGDRTAPPALHALLARVIELADRR